MPAGGTTFHLIRHGDYGMIGRALAGRAPGHALNENGREQAERIAAILCARPITAIVAGPLERTRETAAPLAARLRLDVQVDPGWDEVDFGAWTGKPFSVLHALPEWHEYNRFRGAFPIPGGETVIAVQARALAAIRRLIDAHGEAEVAVFSHGDTIKTVLAHYLGMPLDLLTRLAIDPGSRSELVIYDADAQARTINLPAGF